MSVAATGIGLPAGVPEPTRLRRLSTFLYRHAGLLTLLLLAPPLLWLGIIYLGSLFALLMQSFFSFDDFTGQVVYELTLRSYAELLTSPPISTSSCAPSAWRRRSPSARR